MTTVAPMAKEKKSEKPAPNEAGMGRKETKGVRVSLEFHRKLKMIAASVDKELGEIVEAEMKIFIEREWQRLRESG